MEDSRVLLDTVYGTKPEKGRAFKQRPGGDSHTVAGPTWTLWDWKTGSLQYLLILDANGFVIPEIVTFKAKG